MSTGDTIWVTHSGEWGDTAPVGYYHTEEEAELVASAFDDGYATSEPVGLFVEEVRAGLKCWAVEIFGVIAQARRVAPRESWVGHESQGGRTVVVWAADSEAAFSSARELLDGVS